MEAEGKHKLYYADGSALSLIPSVPYAWQEKGTRIELPSFRSPKNLSLFGIWDAKLDLNLYSLEGSMTSEVICLLLDDFCQNLQEKSILILDNASVHTSALFKKKIKEWSLKGLEIFFLPTYSPKLNLIEHLWRFIKYEWIDFNAYKCWENLVQYIEDIALNFGIKYTINFD